ncbi:MAG: VOC family protein [Hyphomonadaceae bacterium]|nr:VOC family protein [Hyphomonadaceae bacterium]
MWAPLVPELTCRDLSASLEFYVDLLGFAVRFQRLEEGFAYLDLAGAQLMLETAGDGWQTGPLVRPFGRGVNFQIEVADAQALAGTLEAAGWPLFEPLHEAWYRENAIEHGQLQFLVQDPDGYLLRLMQPLGERPSDTAVPGS